MIEIGKNPQGQTNYPNKKWWVKSEHGFLHYDLTWHSAVWTRENIFDWWNKWHWDGLYESKEEAKDVIRRFEHQERLGENKICSISKDVIRRFEHQERLGENKICSI
jgi:hypothetical protein